MKINKLLFVCLLSVSMFSTSCFSMQDGDEEKKNVDLSSLFDASDTTESRKQILNEQLLQATYHSNTKEVETLLNQGADVNCKGQWQIPPLNLAAHNDDVETVTLLIERGASPFITSFNGQTVLHAVCSSLKITTTNGQNVCEYTGKSPNARNNNNLKAIAIIVFLLSRKDAQKADINAVDNKGRTPYSLAREYKSNLALVFRDLGATTTNSCELHGNCKCCLLQGNCVLHGNSTCCVLQ